jgi:ATP-binding cassette, subfamily B, bacterial
MANKYPKVTVKDVVSSYWQVIKTLRFWFWVAVIASAASTIFDLITPLYYRDFFNGLENNTGRLAEIPHLKTIIIFVFLFNFLEWFSARIANVGMDRLQSRGASKLKSRAYEYLLKHSYTFFANTFTGSLTQRINRYARAYERLLDRIVWNVIPLVIRIIGTIVIFYSIAPKVTYIVVIWMIVFLTFNYFFAKYKLKYDVEKAAADTKTSAVLADTITNHNTIQLFTGQKTESKLFKKVAEAQAKITLFIANLDNVMESTQSFFMIAMEFVLFYFSINLWATGQISLGTFVLFQSYVLGLGYRLWDFSRIVRDFYEGFADAKEMVEIIKLPHEIQDVPNASKLKVSKGEVEFRDIEFSFNENRVVLNKINLVISGGEKIALIGPSGAGKSTFVRLLLRLYEVNKGEILIDGQDIKKATQESLHENISLVPQDPILFHRTLMENIRYGRKDATDEEVIAAARLAHCDDFIESLPLKYETFVGERGIKLSGGERQRVAIARAILKNAPILVLDEATSSLDSHSEHLIQDALEKLMKGKTVIVIAHRLSTIQKMDRIVVVQDGQIVEEGSHNELLQKEDGLYQKLWNLQAGGFIKDDGDTPALEGEKDEEDED